MPRPNVKLVAEAAQGVKDAVKDAAKEVERERMARQLVEETEEASSAQQRESPQ